MAFVLSSISGNLISAASAGFAPTNSADVSAIASAYQVVSATATQLYAGTAYVTSVNDAPLSASRAGNAANASLASSAWYDGTGRLISALPDSAAVSAIASAYAESAASGKQDELTFAYDDDKISAINGSALAGQGGGGGSVVSPSGTITVTDGSSLEATNSAIGTAEGLDINNSGQANRAVYPNYYEHLGGYYTFNAMGIGLTYNSSTETRTAWVSANTDLGNLVSSFVLPASSISAGGLLSTSNIISIWDSQLKVDGGSLTLSGSYPVLFVYPGTQYSVVKELAWKDDIPAPINIGVYENIYNDKYVSSIDSIPVSAKWAGSANYTYTAAQDPNGRNLTALADKTSIPTGVTSPNGTIITNGFSVEATNSAVTTTVVPGYDTTVVGWAYEISPSTPIVCTLPSANENSKLFFPLNYGGTIVVSAVYNGITATTSVDGSNTANVVFNVPNATTVSLYGSWYRNLSGSASASASDYLAPGSIGELAWASALPTYSYDAEDKISAINGSAIAGGGGGATGDYVEKSATDVAIGSAVSASGSSMAQGSLNTAYSNSFAQGYLNRASSISFAQGTYNKANIYSFAQGIDNSADSDGFAQGYKNTGRNLSFAQGERNSADMYSLAQGNYSTAYGVSFAQGSGVSAKYTATVFGINNLSGNGSASSGAAFVIGDGTAEAARHDLMVVTKDGEITLYSGTADTTGTGIMSSIRAISAAATGGGAGVDSATVSAIASSYAESAVSSVSGNYYTTANESGYALSSDVSGTVDLVSTQSANWGGSALQLSAGAGISLTLSGNVLIIATAEA